MRATAVLAGLVCLALGALAASTAAGSRAPVATCDSIITPAGEVSWRPRRVVLGVAAVPPAYIPQTEPGKSGRWRFWSKSGLVIRADSPPVRISVPRRFRDRAAIEWGNTGPVSALTMATCPGGGPLGEWNPFAGGFYLRSRAACVPLTFRVGGRSATVRFGVGKRCR